MDLTDDKGGIMNRTISPAHADEINGHTSARNKQALAEKKKYALSSKLRM